MHFEFPLLKAGLLSLEEQSKLPSSPASVGATSVLGFLHVVCFFFQNSTLCFVQHRGDLSGNFVFSFAV